MEVSIKAKHLSLSVPEYTQHDRGARHWGSMFLGAMFDPPKRSLAHLLKDLTFEIKDGDRMALLGQNGAGKSTLLKVLNGAYAPTSGTLAIHGRSHALLNMSLGFNGQATVRENIFLRGTAMGLHTSYVRQHIDDILEFADMPEKVNQRLLTLSSGQKMRLGFAISTVVQQDIVLLDEWIGTGDANFREKAMERLQNRVEGSKIVVLASHQAGLLRDVCNRGMVLDHGRLLYVGDIDAAIKFYQNVLALQWASGSGKVLQLAQGTPLVYGYVDEMAVETPGQVALKGWMASTEGPYPTHLVLEAGGERYLPVSVRKLKRTDVVKRFGLDDPQCGFQATFDVPGVQSLAGLRDAKVRSGLSADGVGTLLRHSEKVAVALKTATEA